MEEEIEDLLKRASDAFRRRDASALAELYHPHAKHRLPTGGVAVGREAIREHLPQVFAMIPESVESELLAQHIDLITPDVAIIDSQVQNYLLYETGFTGSGIILI